MYNHQNFSKNLLEDLYTNKNLSTIKIGKMYDCHYTTVERYLRKYNIPFHEKVTKFNCIITEELLKEYYEIQKLSIKECSRKFNCGSKIIFFYLKKYKLVRAKSTDLLTKEILEELYTNKRFSTVKCGEILHHTAKTIWDYLNKFNIPIRSQSESQIGKHHTEESKRKISISISQHQCGENNPMYGKHHSEESRRKISDAIKGEKNPFYGKTHSIETKQKISESMTGKLVGDINPSKRLDVRRKISDSLKEYYGLINNIPKNIIEEYYLNQYLSLSECSKKLNCCGGTILGYLKKYNITIRTKQDAQTGRKHPQSVKDKMSLTRYNLWKDLDYCNNQQLAQHLHPNKPESFLISLLAELYPNQWQYVGDFSYWINGKNPDFVNKEQKLVIEFFGDYWHKEEDELIRQEHFGKEGYETLVVWEHELKANLDELVYKIKSFVD